MCTQATITGNCIGYDGGFTHEFEKILTVHRSDMAKVDRLAGFEPNFPQNRTLEEQMVNGFLTIMTKRAT